VKPEQIVDTRCPRSVKEDAFKEDAERLVFRKGDALLLGVEEEEEEEEEESLVEEEGFYRLPVTNDRRYSLLFGEEGHPMSSHVLLGLFSLLNRALLSHSSYLGRIANSRLMSSHVLPPPP